MLPALTGASLAPVAPVLCSKEICYRQIVMDAVTLAIIYG